MLDRGNSVIKLNGNADMLGENTPFRSIVSNMVKQVVNDGKWFSFGNVIDKNQINLITVPNNSGNKIGDYLPEELFSLNGYRTKLYKYMILDYMCYCEVPSERKVDGMFKASFNKMIITSNMTVVAEWLGITVEEAEAQYGIYRWEEDDGEVMFPYLKLIVKNGERKITKPRTHLDLEKQGIRVMPMFALKEGVDALYKLLSETSYNVTFLKDGGQVRVMNTTFSKDLVNSLYPKNKEFINSNWSLVYDGDFSGNSTMDRGYIRVFELGSSIYNNPTRSINFARIIGFEKAEPDMSYMYIDLESTLETFTKCLYSRTWSDSEIAELLESLEDFEVGTTRELNGAKVKSVMQLENWANQQNILLSTVFIRSLALCMIANPHLFNGYTGTPEVLSGLKDDDDGDDGSSPVDLAWDF